MAIHSRDGLGLHGPLPGDKFVVSRSGEADDSQAKSPNRKFWFVVGRGPKFPVEASYEQPTPFRNNVAKY
jgi:hypothetical protein